jgi:hypothetical protein
MTIGGTLEAQIPFDPCVDREAQPIRGVVDNTLPYAGAATVALDGEPVIVYNKSSLSRSSPQVRRFIYLHECGHHALRHVWKDASRLREMEADCWAIQHMVEQGLVEERKVDELQAEIGVARGIGSLKGCIDVKTDEELWRRRLDLLSLAGTHAFDAIRGDPIIEDPEPGYFESTLDLPGIFNCELTPKDTFTCVIFDGRDEGSAIGHFGTVRSVIETWLTDDWLTFERTRARPTELRRFVAQAIESGALLTLVITSEYDIRFEYQPVP